MPDDDDAHDLSYLALSPGVGSMHKDDEPCSWRDHVSSPGVGPPHNHQLSPEGLSDDDLGHWEKTGKRTYRGFELEIELDWNFMEAARRMSWPEVAHPTTIIHGSRDEVVSLYVSFIP